MELSRYVRMLRKRWYIVVFLTAMALLGVWKYNQITSKVEAVGVATVLYPYQPAPGEYVPPLITFDVMDESAQLAERVAKRLNDGTTAADLDGVLHIDIQISSKPSATPLYEITAKARAADRAKLLANLAAEEGSALFEEINTPKERDFREGFQRELSAATRDVDSTKAALNQFELDNDARDLPARRTEQQSIVSQLRLMILSSSVATNPSIALNDAKTRLQKVQNLQTEFKRLNNDLTTAQTQVLEATDRASNLSSSSTASSASLKAAKADITQALARARDGQTAIDNFKTTNNISDVQAALQSQQALVDQLALSSTSTQSTATAIRAAFNRENDALDRMTRLSPDYDQLNLAYLKAQARLSSVEQRVLDVTISQALPAAPEVKLLQTAKAQSNFRWQLVTYALALILGLFVSLSLVYMLALMQPLPLTMRYIELELGLPVLSSIAAPGSKRELVEGR